MTVTTPNTYKSAEKYRKLYKIQKTKTEKYEEKDYDRRMTNTDKKIAESRFTYRGEKLQAKHAMLLVIMFFVLMVFIGSSFPYPKPFTTGAYTFLFFMLYIAFLYNVNSKFYWVFFCIFIVIFLICKPFSFFNFNVDEMNNE